MIKAVIFDFGGVLVRTRDWSVRHQWEDRLKLRKGTSDELVFGKPMGVRAQLGEISSEDLWNWIGKELELSRSELINFRKDFWSQDFLDTGLVSLIRKLKLKYQTAIISNAMDDLRHDLVDRYHIADDFDLIVISGEEGVMKPDSEIYQRTLDRLELAPSEIVFIDDSQANIAGALSVGMNAIHYTQNVDIVSSLEEFGLDVKGVN